MLALPMGSTPFIGMTLPFAVLLLDMVDKCITPQRTHIKPVFHR
jgi:hypothetical protein